MTIEEAAREYVRTLAAAHSDEAVAKMMGVQRQHILPLVQGGRGRYVALRHLDALAVSMNIPPSVMLKKLAAIAAGERRAVESVEVAGLVDPATAEALARPGVSAARRRKGAVEVPAAPTPRGARPGSQQR